MVTNDKDDQEDLQKDGKDGGEDGDGKDGGEDGGDLQDDGGDGDLLQKDGGDEKDGESETIRTSTPIPTVYVKRRLNIWTSFPPQSGGEQDDTRGEKQIRY